MNKPHIGVVIVHFGQKDDTIECITSLSTASHDVCTLTIYLVDNDARHRITRAEIRTDLPIKRIELKDNSGWGRGSNVGTRQALADGCNYVLWINNDVVVEKNFFTSLIPYLSKAELVSPLITFYDDPQRIWCTDGSLNTRFLFTTYPYMNRRLSDVSLPETILSDYAGTCLFIHSRVLKKIGLVDERYFINAEDVEWCYRAHQAGYKLIYVTQPVARHKVSANTGIRGTNLLSPLSAYYYARNFFMFLTDHRSSIPMATALIGQFCIRFPYYTIFQCRSLKTITQYIRGLRDGLRYMRSHTL